jgi:hypothetical protein
VSFINFVICSVVLLAASALVTLPASAEIAVSEAAKGMIGSWEISNVDRDRRCALAFSIDPVPRGFKLEFDPACAEAYPSLGNVIAWNFGPKDKLHFYDDKGGTVLEFTEVEGGLFESERGADGLLFLQTQAALKVETRTAEQIVGDWNLIREADKPLCRLTLSDAAGPAAETYRVVVKPGCDKAIATFGLAGWQIDRDQLILIGRTASWRFSESDAKVWERVPLTTDPLLLVRQ